MGRNKALDSKLPEQETKEEMTLGKSEISKMQKKKKPGKKWSKKVTLAQKNINDPEWLSDKEIKKSTMEPDVSMRLRDSKKYNYFVILPDDKFKVS